MYDKSWILISFSLALITALGALILKYIGMNYPNDRDTSMIIGLIVAVMAGLLALILLCCQRKKVYHICNDINNKKKNIKYLMIILAVIFIINVCLSIYALNKAENPAYAQIIKNTNVIFVLLLSILLFKTKIDKRCILGVVLCILGIAIIIYYN